jgi:hypothetical protein
LDIDRDDRVGGDGIAGFKRDSIVYSIATWQPASACAITKAPSHLESSRAP